MFSLKNQKAIDKCVCLCYNIKAFNGRLAQLGEHLPYKQRVTGSSPVLSTKGKYKRYGRLCTSAQGLEVACNFFVLSTKWKKFHSIRMAW